MTPSSMQLVGPARFMLAAALLFGSVPAAVEAQDYTHPREMDLPQPADPRPDPTSLQLRLDNGLVAYVAEDHRAPLVTFTAFVNAGVADGAPGEAAAVAAALRRGPASMAAADFRAALDRLAADYSVNMSHERTDVTLDVLAEDAREAATLFAEVIRSPSFGDPASGGPSRTTQAEGIDFDSSIAGAIDAFEAALFQGHPYGRRASDADVTAAHQGGAEAYHGRFFVPANTTLAISGAFSAAEARAQVEAEFGDWPAADRPDMVQHATVATTAPRQVLQAQADKLQGWVVIGHELPRIPAEDRAALQVMDYILGAYHLDTRLFRVSRSMRGLTNDNSSFLEPSSRGPGTYTMQTYGRPEVVQLLVDLTFTELNRMRDEPVTEEELFIATGALADGTHAKRYSTGEAAARSLATEWLRFGHHDWSAGYQDAIRSVTIEQVQAMARKYLHPDRMLIAVVGPLDEITSAPTLESEPPLSQWGEVRRIDGGGAP